jgi:hypothetical protein
MSDAPTVVFVYGPPGVGKLTVASEVCRLTGFALFDNHTSVDWARQIFEPTSPFGKSPEELATDPFFVLRDRLRVVVFEEAMRARKSIVTTYVYSEEVSQDYVDAVCEAVEGLGGTVSFVRLSCAQDEHERRVESPGRGERGKMTTAARLRQVMGQMDLTSPIAGRESFQIDTTGTPPAEVAERIASHFGLSGVGFAHHEEYPDAGRIGGRIVELGDPEHGGVPT